MLIRSHIRDEASAIFCPPSSTLLRFAREFAADRAKPVLDVGCGFGRNAIALALVGLEVICVDRDLSRLAKLAALGPEYMDRYLPAGARRGRLHPVCAELGRARWPFLRQCLSAAVCVQFFELEILEALCFSLVSGGHLYIETAGNHGGNYIDLPPSGQLRAALSTEFDLPFYTERKAGPPGCDAVSARVLARKR